MSYSFIIPVFNCRETLADCVGSIRKAGLPDYEILLIDDGSTDGSGAFCDALAAKFPEIRTFHQPGRGVSAARNRGLAEAQKTYILFADGDDVLDSEVLGKVLANTGDLLIFGVVMEYWHRGVCYGQAASGYLQPGLLDWRRDAMTLFEGNLLAPVWNKVYRREILLEQNLRFREELFLYEDLEFVLRYLKHCEKVVWAPNPVYHYRMSSKASERIKKLGPISVFLRPLEAALADASLPGKTVDALRLRLFEILAWEKCGMAKGSALCRDFQTWYETLAEKPEYPSKLVRHLLRGRGLRLKLWRKGCLLRHALAVEVKTWMQRKN